MAKFIKTITTNSIITELELWGKKYVEEMRPDPDNEESGWCSPVAYSSIFHQVDMALSLGDYIPEYDRDRILEIIEEIGYSDEYDIPELLAELEGFEN